MNLITGYLCGWLLGMLIGFWLSYRKTAPLKKHYLDMIKSYEKSRDEYEKLSVRNKQHYASLRKADQKSMADMAELFQGLLRDGRLICIDSETRRHIGEYISMFTQGINPPSETKH